MEYNILQPDRFNLVHTTTKKGTPWRVLVDADLSAKQEVFSAHDA